MLVRVDSWRIGATLIGGLDDSQLQNEHLIRLMLDRDGDFILKADQADKLALRLEHFAQLAETVVGEQSADYAKTIDNEDLWFNPLCYLIVDELSDRRVRNYFGGILGEKDMRVGDLAWALRKAAQAAREKRKVEFESGTVTRERLAENPPVSLTVTQLGAKAPHTVNKAVNLMLSEHQVKTVVDYFTDQVLTGDDRPPAVVEALLKLRWPDRSFRLLKDRVEEELVIFSDYVDVATGENAHDLFIGEAVRLTAQQDAALTNAE